MVKDDRANVMLDPSLLLVERSLSDVANNLTGLSDDFSFHVSNHFYDILQEGKPESATIDYFRYTSRLGDIDRLNYFLEENREYIQKFEIPDWASREYSEAYNAIIQSLSAKYRYDKDLCNIIFEEWFFLKEHSWLVARTKRIFNLFIRSGVACLEFGNRIFDQFTRMSTRLPRDNPITNVYRLKAISKWIALAGTSYANLFEPRIQALVEWGIGSYIILVDP